MRTSSNALHQTGNTLAETIRRQSVELLNRNLASAIDLKEQAKQAHWNVKGPSFIALHELFDGVDKKVRHRITVGAFLDLFPHIGEPPNDEEEFF